jgi:hypothetical protein
MNLALHLFHQDSCQKPQNRDCPKCAYQWWFESSCFWIVLEPRIFLHSTSYTWTRICFGKLHPETSNSTAASFLRCKFESHYCVNYHMRLVDYST